MSCNLNMTSLEEYFVDILSETFLIPYPHHPGQKKKKRGGVGERKEKEERKKD